MTLTADELSIRMAVIRQRCDEDLALLNRQAELAVEQSRAAVLDAVKTAGFKPCPDCQCFGAVERLDASYMRRFGLREWDGCETCGGHGDRKGRGFVK